MIRQGKTQNDCNPYSESLIASPITLRIHLPRRLATKAWLLSVFILLFSAFILLQSPSKNPKERLPTAGNGNFSKSLSQMQFISNQQQAKPLAKQTRNPRANPSSSSTTASPSSASSTTASPSSASSTTDSSLNSSPPVSKSDTIIRQAGREHFFARMNERLQFLRQMIQKKKTLMEHIVRRPASSDPKKNSRYSQTPSHGDQSTLKQENEKTLLTEEAFLQASLATFQDFSFAFNQNLSTLPHIQPVKTVHASKINSLFGIRWDPFGRKFLKHHAGVDLKGSMGQTVFAAANGIVIETRRSQSGYGNMIRIAHSLGYETVYAHLKRISVKKGSHVSGGQAIGQVGASGAVTGPHLHYEVRYKKSSVDPLRFGIKKF